MKKFLFIFFVFIGLFSISYAEIIQPNITYNKTVGSSNSFSSQFGYSHSQINDIINNYMLNGNEEPYKTLLDTFSTNNCYYVIINSGRNTSKPYGAFLWTNEEVDCGYDETNNILFINSYSGSMSSYTFYMSDYAPSGSSVGARYGNYRWFYACSVLESNFPIKAVNCPTTTSAVWDGTSYYYDGSTELPEGA